MGAMRILLASDARKTSVGAIRVAAALAAEGGATVEARRVLEPLTAYAPGAVEALAYVHSGARDWRIDAARAELDEILTTVAPSAAEWPRGVEVGPIVPTIIRAADEIGAELIVLGQGRHNRIDRLFGSETAVRVMRLSHIPVYAVPSEATGRPRSLVSAVDFSDFAKRALRDAIRISAPDATIHLVHVLWPSTSEVPGLAPDAAERIRLRARRALEELAVELASGDRRFELHLREGDIADEILDLAKEVEAEALVAGSHGLGFFGRVLLGSVSSVLVRRAECAIFVMPPVERASDLGRNPGGEQVPPVSAG